MLASVKTLFKSPYNRQHPIFALYRLFCWKAIKFCRKENIRYSLWGDRKIYLNHDSFHSMWIMYNYIVDWEEFNLIKNIVKPGDIVADIGANIGFYSIWLSKFTSGPAAVHSFEPDEKNHKRLACNIKLNNLQQVVAGNRIAIGDKDGEAFFTQGLDGENHIVADNDPGAAEVKITTLTQYCDENKIQQLKYCKIDVEGFELSVLKGAAVLLADKKIGVVQLEINSTIKNSGATPAQVVALLDTFCYTLCRYDVKRHLLLPQDYTTDRENYFAVADINDANNLLRQSL